MINIILLLAEQNTYFLFTAYAPYLWFAEGWFYKESAKLVLAIAVLVRVLWQM